MQNDEQPWLIFILIGTAHCLGATMAVLLASGAGISTAIAVGVLAAIFGAVLGWIWILASQG